MLFSTYSFLPDSPEFGPPVFLVLLAGTLNGCNSVIAFKITPSGPVLGRDGSSVFGHPDRVARRQRPDSSVVVLSPFSSVSMSSSATLIIS